MSATEPTIRVVIADDHPVTREGICTILSAAQDIEVVGVAKDGREVQELVAALHPDILLLDLVMPGPRPAEIQAWVRAHHPGTTTLVLTAHDRACYLAEMARVGCAGFLTKEQAPRQLIAAIRCAAQGDVLLTLDQLARIQSWEEDVDARWQCLTARERKVLVLMAGGKTTAHIAAALVVTKNTVRTHIGNLLGKLELESRVAAIAWAWKHGFVENKNDVAGS